MIRGKKKKGVGVIEIVLILGALVAVALLFRKEIIDFIIGIFNEFL